MTNWKAGMKAVCIATSWCKFTHFSRLQGYWYLLTGKRPKANGPARNEMVTVSWTMSHPEFGTGLILREYRDDEAFLSRAFRPLLDNENEAALDRIEEESKVEPELVEL